MSLILEEGNDNVDSLQISLINDLSLNEWHYLLSKIKGKVNITYEKNSVIFANTNVHISEYSLSH